MFRSVTAVLSFTLLATPGLAQQAIDESRPVSPEGVVSVTNVAGSVEISTWDRDVVSVTGTLGRGSERLRLDVDGDRAEIEVVLPEGRNRDVRGSDLVLRVPARSRLHVQVVSADLRVDTSGPSVDVGSVSGSTRITGGASEIRINTVSGDARIATGPQTRTVRAQSVSAAIEIAGDAHADLTLHAQTVSGAVRLGLPADLHGDVSVQTFSGRIVNELSDDRPQRGGWAPSGQLSFSTGGDADIRVQTLSGKVRLTRAGKLRGSERRGELW